MMDILLSDSEWESSSESGSSEEQEKIDFSYGGQAMNILSSLEESIGKIDDFLSFDQGFTQGDIVCSVKDPSGQTGRVINVNILVDLENIHGNIISDVNYKNILKIRSFSVGDYVVLGAWLGRVNKIVDSVTVVFDDGSQCEVIAADQEKLLPIFSNVLEDSQYPYYPGQRVKARLSKFSKSVIWLCGTRRDYQVEGTVCKVDAGVVYVDWLASALMGSDLNLAAPPRVQNSKNLTLLSDFSYANWQLGDWCMLPTADRKVIMEPTFINSPICDKKKLKSGLKRRNLSSSLAEIFVIVKTKSKVDVLWQDGSCSLDLDFQTLLPVSIVNSHEFWPEQFVLEKGISDDPHISNSQRWGVVRGVDAKEKIVTVQWIKNEATVSDKDQTEETLSAYGLVEHPDYTYCYGDVVFKLAQNQFDMGKEEALEGNNCTWDQIDCPDKHYLSCIGIVTGFKDGAVEVRWATGFTTKVGPNEIYGIDKYEGSAATPVLHEDNIEELNPETSGKQYSIQEEMNLLNFNGGEVCKKYRWESSSFSFPLATIGFFTSIATSLFGSLGSTSESGSLPSGQITKDANESQILLQKEVETHDICSEPRPIDLLTLGKTNLIQEVEGNVEKEELQVSTTLGKSNNFRQFDMVSNCSDHHYFGVIEGLAPSQVKRAWVKKVQQEWSILERTLPETIYVRIYEDRMDLIRAAIIGVPGTPYHDGLFFFDIFLPPEYPHEPPLVHYISGGLQVNPNLYESGKVCLSLLNTWSGTGSEVWNPGNSTILQVLLSLQALVLNEKPYFNEAGYDKQVGRAEGEKNSVSYNENAFLVTCQSMLYLLHKPPKHFKELVEEHFTRRSTYILWACKAYMEGASVGSAFGCKDDGENSKGCSRGFKIMLAKLLPKLVEAFSGNGIDCSQFTEPEKWMSCTGSN